MITKSERAWFDAITEHGCIINNSDCGGKLERHHITDGGRRLGHLFTLPLCRWHHHWDSPLPIGHAYGKGKKPWAANHGNEMDLLIALQGKLLGAEHG